ncbi:MAG: M28 family peptidase, partial [Candidatus Edwardsbacteria bacterium]|nr:M28 family peptidase [Candidatus Edwardsbacteria bacterium]
MKKPALMLVLAMALSLPAASGQYSEKAGFADSARVWNDLVRITGTPRFRNYRNIDILDSVAAYIQSELAGACDTVWYQPFTVNGAEYRNVIGSLGPRDAPRIIIGSHYDVCGDQPGADDNASGVAGLLELARLLSKDTLKYRIDLVAYTLEEPPFFRSNGMGSYIHAKSRYDQKIPVKGMICLEMIGYYNDAPGSQRYPLGLLKLFYGKKGDFITVVGKFGGGAFAKRIANLMKKHRLVKTRSFKG